MQKTLFLLLVIFIVLSCKRPQQADLILHHAQIFTVDSVFSSAQALAIKDGRIIGIGNNDEILNTFWTEESIDLNQKYVYPGFIDAHSHFMSYGLGKVSRADLTGTHSFKEILERLKEFDEKFQSEWLVGRGWDQNDWALQEFPTKDQLDEIWPHKPVYLTRIDGHAALVNSKALELADITAQTKIHGGEIILKNGHPTGVLIDNAMDKVRELMPATSMELKEKAIGISQEDCFKVGLTSVCDAGLEYMDIELIQKLQEKGQLKMKIYAMLTPTAETLEKIMCQGPIITDRLVVRSVKLYADGALGSRGACLLHDYHDKAHWKGMMLSPQAYYDSLCHMADQYGYQVNTHAIGDSANRVILKTYARYLKGDNDKRWRIEHAQVVHPDDFYRFEKYDIVPSVQPTHATSDMYWADERLGPERIKSAYAFEALRKENGWIPLGTDFPIENTSPLLTYYAAVARMDLEQYPEDGFQTENALTREDALRGISIWAAKAAFEENEKGSLELNKWADLVVLDQNILEIEEAEIPNTQVLMTLVNGEMVYIK